MHGNDWIQQKKKFTPPRHTWELKNIDVCFPIAGSVSVPSPQARQSILISSSLSFVFRLFLNRGLMGSDSTRRSLACFFASGSALERERKCRHFSFDQARLRKFLRENLFLSVEWLWCYMYIFGLKKFRKVGSISFYVVPLESTAA
jgi:hypothetical protein